jgi:hypothetical protein
LDSVRVPKNDSSLLYKFAVEHDRNVPHAAINILIGGQLTQIDRLQRGVRFSKGQYPYVWEEGIVHLGFPATKPAVDLALLAACKARLLSDSGQKREAAELLLDIAQFGRDVGYNGLSIPLISSCSIYAISFNCLRDLISSNELSRDDLAEVARELEILDNSFPSLGPTLQNETLEQGLDIRSAVREAKERLGGGAVENNWRYGFSSRYMFADAWLSIDRDTTSIAELEGHPWLDIVRAIDEEDHRIKKSRNPALGVLNAGNNSLIFRLREGRAQLRLLRVAARFLATGEILMLQDPFGTTLQHRISEKELTVWSFGRDGCDHGGQGGWKSQTGQDMTATISRR